MKKLSLNKETLQHLDAADVTVNGGFNTWEPICRPLPRSVFFACITHNGAISICHICVPYPFPQIPQPTLGEVSLQR